MSCEQKMFELSICDDEEYQINEVVIKTTIFLSGMEHFSTVNEIYSQYFSSDYPARETVAVKGLPRNVNVEISMIASI